MSDYDAVVGPGAAGAATAHRLARDGRDVLALERGGLPNPRATSHGAGRIFRLVYRESDRYVPLLRGLPRGPGGPRGADRTGPPPDDRDARRRSAGQ